MPVTIANGARIYVTALQDQYALPPSGTVNNFINPELIQDDRFQTFNSVTINTSTQAVDRTNTLSRGKQILPSGYDATLDLSGFVSPVAYYGWFVGQLLDVRIAWNGPFNTELYPIVLRCTVLNIDRNVTVAGAYEISMSCGLNYNFEKGDLRFITPLDRTQPGNRGWIPRTPFLDTLPFSA